MREKNILKFMFAFIGMFWTGECIHELVHLIESGGHYFVVGFGIMPDYWVFGGLSYVTSNKGSELFPYIFEFLFFFWCWKFLYKKVV